MTKRDISDKREQELYELQQLGFDLVWFTDYHCRINGVMDVYPVNGRYHDLKTGDRGSIVGSVVDFIKGHVELYSK